jgi:hypothetical protein
VQATLIMPFVTVAGGGSVSVGKAIGTGTVGELIPEEFRRAAQDVRSPVDVYTAAQKARRAVRAMDELGPRETRYPAKLTEAVRLLEGQRSEVGDHRSEFKGGALDADGVLRDADGNIIQNQGGGNYILTPENTSNPEADEARLMETLRAEGYDDPAKALDGIRAQIQLEDAVQERMQAGVKHYQTMLASQLDQNDDTDVSVGPKMGLVQGAIQTYGEALGVNTEVYTTQEEALAERPELKVAKGEKIKAVNLDGRTIVMVEENIGDAKDAMNQWWHEVGGHRGLDINPKAQRFLDVVKQTLGMDFIKTQVPAFYYNQADNEIVGEYLSRMVGRAGQSGELGATEQEKGVWAQFKAWAGSELELDLPESAAARQVARTAKDILTFAKQFDVRYPDGMTVKLERRTFTRTGGQWVNEKDKAVKDAGLVETIQSAADTAAQKSEARNQKAAKAAAAAQIAAMADANPVIKMVLENGGIAMPKLKPGEAYPDEFAAIPKRFRAKKGFGLAIDDAAAHVAALFGRTADYGDTELRAALEAFEAKAELILADAAQESGGRGQESEEAELIGRMESGEISQGEFEAAMAELSGARFSVDSVKPWPADFPKADVHTTRQAVKSKYGELFEKAKAGDVDSAIEFVLAVVKPEKIKALSKKYPGAIVVPVRAEEATGYNQIPAAFAQAVGEIGGFGVDTEIVQSVRAQHTGKDAMDRIIRRAQFDGEVEAGKQYIIVDDHITQGGTVGELRHYIENNGGQVVFITGLTASMGSTTIAIQSETIRLLNEKFGSKFNEQLRSAGIAGSVEALTESEGRYLLKFSPESIRNKLVASGRQESLFRNGGQVRPSQIDLLFSVEEAAATGPDTFGELLADPRFSISWASDQWQDATRGKIALEDKRVRVYNVTREGDALYESQIKKSGQWATVQYSDNLEEAKNPEPQVTGFYLTLADYIQAKKALGKEWYAEQKANGLSDNDIFGLVDGIDPSSVRINFIPPPTYGDIPRRPGAKFSIAPQVESAEFKAWFGDSKVVDADGKPLVVYHGAPDARFVEQDGTFKTVGERYGESEPDKRVFWFTTSRRTAETYADDRRAFDYQNAEPGIVEAYLILKNPLIVDGGGKEWREAQARGKTSDVIEQAQADGHDGVIIRNVKDDYNNTARTVQTDTFAVFSSNQIKSIYNAGTWDAGNPDIRFSVEQREDPYQATAVHVAYRIFNGDFQVKRVAKGKNKGQMVARTDVEQEADVADLLKSQGLSPSKAAVADVLADARAVAQQAISRKQSLKNKQSVSKFIRDEASKQWFNLQVERIYREGQADGSISAAAYADVRRRQELATQTLLTTRPGLGAEELREYNLDVRHLLDKLELEEKKREFKPREQRMSDDVFEQMVDSGKLPDFGVDGSRGEIYKAEVDDFLFRVKTAVVRKLGKEGVLDPKKDLLKSMRSPVAVAEYRKTLQNVLGHTASELTYGFRRDVIERKIRALDDVKLMSTLDRKAGTLLQQMFDARDFEALDSQVSRVLELTKQFSGRLKYRLAETSQAVQVRALKMFRMIRGGDGKAGALLMEPDAVQAEMENLRKAFDEPERHAPEGSDVAEWVKDAIDRYNMLNRFGAFKYKKAAERADAVGWLEGRIESELKEQEERRAAVKAEAEKIQKALMQAMPRRKTAGHNVRSVAERFADSNSQVLFLEQRLLEIPMFGKDADRKAAEAMMKQLAFDLAAANFHKNNKVAEDNRAFGKELERIYGVRFSENELKELMKPLDAFRQFSLDGQALSRSQVLQMLGMLAQEDIRSRAAVIREVEETLKKQHGDDLSNVWKTKKPEEVAQSLWQTPDEFIKYRTSAGVELNSYELLQAVKGVQQGSKLARRLDMEPAMIEALRTVSPKDFELLNWFRKYYFDNRAALSEINKRVTGFVIQPPDPLYIPSKVDFRRSPIKSVNISMPVVPPSLTPRVFNTRDLDESADIVGIYMSRLESNEQFINFAELHQRIAGIFGNPDLTKALELTHGKRFSDQLGVHLRDVLSGQPITGGKLEVIDGLVNFFAITRLGWNPGGGGDRENPKMTFERPVLKDCMTFVQNFAQNGYTVFGTGKITHEYHRDARLFDNVDGKRNWGFSPVTQGPGPSDGWVMPNGLLRGAKTTNFMPKQLEKIGAYYGPLSDVPDIPPDPKTGAPGYKGWMDWGAPFKYVNENDRDLMADEKSANYAISVLKQPHDKPFFLAVGFCKPHAPLIAPKKYFDLFKDVEIQLPPYKENDLDDCVEVLWENSVPKKYFDAVHSAGIEIWKEWIRAYLACTAFADDQFVRIFQTLESSPYADNTIIIFTSDHGMHLGEKDMLAKMTLWAESTRIPLLVHVPGMKAGGQICSTPVSLIDLYPTLADYCNLPEPPQGLDGFSLRPLVENPNGSWNGPDSALVAWMGPATPEQRKSPYIQADAQGQSFAIVSDRYRFIRAYTGEEELYDHAKDPNEWRNLAGNPEYQTALRDLRMKMDEQLFSAE